MYQESQRENVHIIKSIRAWKACQSFTAITEWNTISAALVPKGTGQSCMQGCVATSSDQPRGDLIVDNEITF